VAAVLIVWYVVEFHNMATVELVVAAVATRFILFGK
jgi:hypothetical protein